MAGLLPVARAQAPTSAWQWAVRGASTGGTNVSSTANRLKVDAAGNSYVSGGFSGQLLLSGTALIANGSIASYVAKYAPDGTLRWIRQLDSSGVQLTIADLGIDGAGNVYLTGTFTRELTIGTTTLTAPATPLPAGPAPNGYVAKLDAQGSVQWAMHLAPTCATALCTALCQRLAVDAAGTVALAGTYQGDVSLGGYALPTGTTFNYSSFVARLAGTGGTAPTVQWLRTAGVSRAAAAQALAWDGTGHLYAGIPFTGPATFGTISLPGPAQGGTTALIRYDAAGTEQWATQLPALLTGNPPIVFATTPGLVLTPYGVYVLATEQTPASSYSAVQQLTQVSTQGVVGWTHSLTTTQTSTGLRSLVADASGNLYVCGSVLGTLSFGGLTLSSTPATTSDGILLSFTPQGTPRWGLLPASGAGDENLAALAFTTTNALHLAGFARGAALLAPLALPATGGSYELRGAGGTRKLVLE